MRKQSPPTLAIRLSEDDRELLNDLAKDAGVSASHLVRIVAREGHNLFKNLPALIEKHPPIYTWSNNRLHTDDGDSVASKGSTNASAKPKSQASTKRAHRG